ATSHIAEESRAAAALTADSRPQGRVPPVDMPGAQDLIARLKTSERRVDHEIRTLLNLIQEQMNSGVAEAERQERAARWAIVGLSLLALGVGLLVTWLSNRALKPIARRTEAAEELGERLREASLEGAGGPATAAALCEAIVREVDRLAAVTEEYLRFARLPKPQLARADLNDAVRDLLDFVRPELEASGVQLEHRFAPDLPEVTADVGQIRQLLLNLIRNAREAMPGGGALMVATQAAADGVLVQIRDAGPGI